MKSRIESIRTEAAAASRKAPVRDTRPDPSKFRKEKDYLTARDAWKASNPNLHTAEEEAAHVASVKALQGKPTRCHGLFLTSDLKGKDQAALDRFQFSIPLSSGLTYLSWTTAGKFDHAEWLASHKIKAQPYPSGAPAPIPAAPVKAKAKKGGVR